MYVLWTKEGNPILINKDDLAQVVGELISVVTTCYKLFCITLIPSSAQWDGISLNISWQTIAYFYNVGFDWLPTLMELPSDGIVGEFYVHIHPNLLTSKCFIKIGIVGT